MPRKAPQIPEDPAEEGGLAAFSLKYYHFTIVLFLVIVGLGTICAFRLPKDLLPASRAPGVQIISFYPGMPVEDMEQELTFPYERYSGQAVGIRAQESRSLTGVSIVRNFFQPDQDVGAAMAQIGTLVMSVLRKLPPGTQPPLVIPFDPMASQPLAIVAISGKGKTETELQDFGRYKAINAVQGVPGAVAPTVMGGKVREAIVYLDPRALNERNLSPVRVNEKLEAMNTFVPAGDIDIGDFNFKIQSDGRISGLEEVDDLYLRSRFGKAIRIRDVGHARDAAAIQTNIVTIDGERKTYIPVYRQLGANSLAVIDGVREAVKALQAASPGIELSVVSDQTVFIRKAINAITSEGLAGGLLAALMILFFLGSARATVAVLLTMPVSILGTFIVLKAFGQSLNVMTLGGLALSVGVLVDNAIVVIEVIQCKRAAGLAAPRAALAGAREVAMPVLASTLATLIVFVPVLFLSGVTQTLFAALALSVGASLAISYFASMMIIPVFSAYLLEGERIIAGGPIGAFRRWFERVTGWYSGTLAWALRRSRAILGWSMALHVLVAGAAVYFLGSELFPHADSGSFTVALRGASGLRLEKTAELTKNVEGALRELIPAHDLRMLISNVGLFYGYSAAFTRNSGTQDAFINVDLGEDRFETTQHYARILRRELPRRFPGVEFSFQLGGLLSSALNDGLEAPFDVQIGGSNQDQLRETAAEILTKIRRIPGTTDVRLHQRFDAPVINVKLDRRRISDVGLTPDLVVKNLVSAVSNSTSYRPNVWVDPKTGIDYLIGVQLSQEDIRSRSDLLKVPVMGPDQERAVPLGSLVHLETAVGATEITHENLQPVLDIFLDTDGRDIGSVGRAVRAVLDEVKLPPGAWSQLRGDYREMTTSVQSLGSGFLLAACLVYLLLVVQFRSFALPAIVMTNVPKGIVGALALLAMTRTFFSIQSAIGCIFVIGVSVSHSVLLLEFIVERVRHATDIDAAILEAARARLRPILMTSLASVLGLLPMALGLGHGSEANIPLGRAVIGGQILSTLLNFYLLPCLYRQTCGRAAGAAAPETAAAPRAAA